MNRFRVGVILLLLLLAAALAIQAEMEAIHRPIAERIDQAMQSEGDTADGKIAEAAADWKRCRGFVSLFADHAPLEDIDALFAQLLQTPAEDSTFAPLCAELSIRLKAMWAAHVLFYGAEIS